MEKKVNIIIADDSPEFIEGLELLFLKKTKFQIIDTCSNGLELINSKKLPNANLLLVDILMPSMNGMEAAHKIKNKYPDLPMIAVTMSNDNIFIFEIMNAGFAGYICKPNVTKDLFAVIELVLEKKVAISSNLKSSKDACKSDTNNEEISIPEKFSKTAIKNQLIASQYRDNIYNFNKFENEFNDLNSLFNPLRSHFYTQDALDFAKEGQAFCEKYKIKVL